MRVRRAAAVARGLKNARFNDGDSARKPRLRAKFQSPKSKIVRSVRVRGGSKGVVHLDLFAGCGGIAKAMRARGRRSIGVDTIQDIIHGKHHHLTNPKIFRVVVRFIRSGRVASVWLGTPCTSFSMARRGRPPALRSRQFPWGVGGLSEEDQERVRLGNILAKRSLAIFREC